MSYQEVPMEHPRPIRRKLAANQIGIIAKEIKFFSQITIKQQSFHHDEPIQTRPAHFSQVRGPAEQSKKKLQFVESQQALFGLSLSLSPANDRALTKNSTEGHTAMSPAKQLATAEKQKSDSKDDTKESSTRLSDAYLEPAPYNEALDKRSVVSRPKHCIYDVLSSARIANPQNSIYEEEAGNETSCESSLSDSLDDIPSSSKTGLDGASSMSMSYRRKI